jgi:hypothetical protein
MDFLYPPKRAPRSLPLGGGGGGETHGGSNREKRTYYNELDAVLNLISGSPKNARTTKRGKKR